MAERKPVTDPALLEKLNAPSQRTPVTDPALLRALEASEDTGRFNSVIPGGNSINAVSRGMGENIPIIGPLVAGAADQVGSHIASWITGNTPEEERARAAALREQDWQENQVAHAVGAGLGMVGPLAQIGAGSQVAGRALGMTGSLPSRIVAGSLSGVGIGGADSLARGQSAEDAAGTALVSGGIGAAMPIAGAAFRAGRSLLAGKPIVGSESILARAIRDDNIPVDQISARLAALGPGAVIADLGPNLQRQAGALASLPGEAQARVRGALSTRAQGTNQRIIGDVDATLGPAPVPSRITAEIEQGMEALGPRYDEVLSRAAPVDTTSLANSMATMARRSRGPSQKAAQTVRNMLNTVEGDALDTNATTLHETRKAIDGMLAGASDTNEIAVLKFARNMVDDALGRSVPGIKQVDAQFAELARQRDAVGRGQQMLDSGRTAPRPAEVQQEMTEGALPQGLQIGPSAAPLRLSQGARAEIERLIGTTANDLNALKTALKGDGSWNRARLASLYGEDVADRLLAILERERTFAQTANVVMGNSETASRQAAQAEVNAGQPANLQNLTLTGLVAGGLQKGANLGAAWRQSGVNADLANALMSSNLDQATQIAVMRALAQQSRPSRFAPAGGSLVTQGLLQQR